ncbi:hypothetical protein ABEB36_004342 [Hypothenemus hampei]
MKFSPHQPLETLSVRSLGLNSYYVTMRHELFGLSQLLIEQRREKLKKLLIEDFLREENELNEVDLGYITTQP